MNQMLQLTEQVWVPYTTVKKISLFGGVVAVTFHDGSVDRLEGEDAERVLAQIRNATNGTN
jgi:hypothetical protein